MFNFTGNTVFPPHILIGSDSWMCLLTYYQGPIVRIAPNEYSIDDFDALKTIYGHGSSFIKVLSRHVYIGHVC